MYKNLEYTHELFTIDTKIYFSNEENYINKINNYFEELYDVNHVFIDDPVNGEIISAIRVRGKVHLYGFKVENGGFFDILGNKYYNENDAFFKRSVIIPVNNETYSDTHKRIL